MAPPPGPIPPALPPSVEEAYRRKCIQLKQRMKEVEEANDASRIRLTRMKRGIEKLRLERAFLLEQLAKRTSTNVEDSEGSPSPPPTPKEKPLRTKRGHRKPSFLTNLDPSARSGGGGGGGASSSFMQTSQALTLSPSNSDAFSHTQTAAPRSGAAVANGTKAAETPKRARNAFELFVNEQRAVLEGQVPKDGGYDVDKELAVRWQELGRDGQNAYYRRFDAGDLGVLGGTGKVADMRDEDVEMGEDGEDEE